MNPYSSYGDALRADEFSFEAGFAILQQHGNNLAQIVLKFIERFRLRMSSGKSGHVAHKQPGILIAFDDSSEGLHPYIIASPSELRKLTLSVCVSFVLKVFSKKFLALTGTPKTNCLALTSLTCQHSGA
jgi:hypothetical protein